VLGSLAIGLGYMGQPHLVLRFMAISSGDAVAKGRAIAVGWAVIAFGGAILTGLAGLAYYGPEALGAGGLFADQEQIMPLLAQNFMPEWLAVIMICGAVAAMMSTADSQLLASASAVSEDIYRRLIDPGAPQARLLNIGRAATLLVGVLAFLLAWRADALVYNLVLYAWAGLGAAFGPPLLLALWWRRTSRAGALSGMIVGTTVVLVWYNVPALKTELYEMIPGFVLSLAATWGASLLWPDGRSPARTGGTP
jgi:sodium/proline symporter